MGEQSRRRYVFLWGGGWAGSVGGGGGSGRVQPGYFPPGGGWGPLRPGRPLPQSRFPWPVSNDPVEAGLVTSLAHPGGNITGVTFVSSDIAAKRLQFLRDIAPNFTRLAVIWNPDHVDPEYREIQSAGKTMGIQIRSLEVRSTEDFDSAFETAANDRIQALMPITSRLMLINRARIIEFSKRRDLLLASGFGPWAGEGAVLSYGPDIDASTMRAAAYVDKILRGANNPPSFLLAHPPNPGE